MLEMERGRITVGWLIIQDLVMVFTLVLLPPAAGLLGGRPAAETRLLGGFVEPQTVGGIVALTFAKVAAFMAVMLVLAGSLTTYNAVGQNYFHTREKLVGLSSGIGSPSGDPQIRKQTQKKPV